MHLALQALLVAVLIAAAGVLLVTAVELAVHVIAAGVVPTTPEAKARRALLTWWAAGGLALVAVAWGLIALLNR